MKLLLFGCLIGLALSTVAAASPPSEIKLTYDLKEHILKATIVHDTKNVIKHHIGKVTVNVNGSQIILQQFSSQLNNDEQPVVYFIIDAKKGDEIALAGVCNIYGQMTARLTVSE